jgi:RNA polymerase sigma factor (TIGR02999 family)
MGDAPDLSPAPFAEVTDWLRQQPAPQAQAVSDQLFASLYDELRRMARAHLYRETGSHTLSATALSHEAWFRLSAQTRTAWRNRSHFLAVASMMMRRILVNHELARRADKRAVEMQALTLSALEQLALPPDRDVVAVHEALLALEAQDARVARGVELRFFGGLQNEEIAEALGISLATVKRDWVFARAWLHRELTGQPPPAA